MNNTDKDWEILGSNDPYWAVVTHEKYRKENINRDAIDSFFQSGKEYILDIFKIIHEKIDPSFNPIKAIDFGCGVGRVSINLSNLCETVLGVDISDSMLNEAKKNCSIRNINNIMFAKSDDQLSNVKGKYDFVHSFIVFQHIPRSRGEIVFKKLVSILNDEGVGAVHFTYFNKVSKLGKFIKLIYTKVPFGTNIINILKQKKMKSPIMQMNNYNLNKIFYILQENGCHNIYLRFTRHSQHCGAIIFFQKKAMTEM